jgi:hypothetical protein
VKIENGKTALLYKDDHAVYMTFSFNVGTRKRPLIAVTAMIPIKERFITFTTYEIFESKSTFEGLLEQAKGVVAETTQTNGLTPSESAIPQP